MDNIHIYFAPRALESAIPLSFVGFFTASPNIESLPPLLSSFSAISSCLCPFSSVTSVITFYSLLLLMLSLLLCYHYLLLPRLIFPCYHCLTLYVISVSFSCITYFIRPPPPLVLSAHFPCIALALFFSRLLPSPSLLCYCCVTISLLWLYLSLSVRTYYCP